MKREKKSISLTDTDASFRILVETVKDYAIFLLDPDGFVESWNAGAERIKGYTADQIIGQHFSTFYPRSEIEAGKPARELEIAIATGRYEEEGWRLRRDGSLFWASVVITALRRESGEVFGFAKVTRDLTERRKMEEELRERAAALEETGRRKDEFLAMLSHELRNPLAAILNAAELLRVRGMADPQVQRAQEVIIRQSRHQGRLLDDLLDVSRITRGTISLRKQPVALARIISHAVETSRSLIEGKQHRLSVLIPLEPISLDADATRLEQVISNLLNNAARYTEPGGRIWLTAEPDDGEVVISVRDTGVGISPELLPKVFELFTQGERTLARTEGGLGIGLTLVRSLVNMHGGSVEARSEGVGKGSEFLVRLPALPTDRMRELPDRPAQPTVAPPPLTRAVRVLVVEDNVDAAEILARLLEEWGFDAQVVYDGSAAVAMAGGYHPDVVLLDIGLPGISGYEVARRLREQPALRDAHLVAVTGYGMDEDRSRSEEAGIAVHLTKPVDADELHRVLRHVSADERSFASRV